MTEYTKDTTIGHLVAQRANRARIFERHGIDYCCGGGRSLAVACAEKGVDVQRLIQELLDDDNKSQPGDRDWSAASMSELVDNILATHHTYLKSELPRLAFLVNKVAAVHGERHPELIDVKKTYDLLKAELDCHIKEEEEVLFPECRKFESGDTTGRSPKKLSTMISTMESEHEAAGEALRRLRELTDDYTPPDDACGSFRAMLAGLEELEQDMHIHVNKENYALYPRAVKAESELASAAQSS